MLSTRHPLLVATGIAAGLVALAPGGAPAAEQKPPTAQSGRRAQRGRPAPSAAPRSRAPAVRRGRALRSARYSLEVSASVTVDWTQRTRGESGCYRSEVDFRGFERWNVRTRRPALVTIEEMSPGGDLKLVYAEADRGRPDRPTGVEVGGSWERRAQGKWRQHPITGSPSCAGAVYSEGAPEQQGCGTLLPQQYADLRLNIRRVHMAFSDADNLPDKRPHGICLHWTPTSFGDMPEWIGDLATDGISRQTLLTLKPGRTLVLGGRHHTPQRATRFPPTLGVKTSGTYTWQARLTRVKDVSAG